MSWPMVRNPVLASTIGLLTLRKSAAMLFGYWLIMNWRNSGVSIVFVDDRMLDDDSPKNEPKKNVLFLVNGPPTGPPNSFRRDARNHCNQAGENVARKQRRLLDGDRRDLRASRGLSGFHRVRSRTHFYRLLGCADFQGDVQRSDLAGF